MCVCLCQGVTDRQIRAAAEEGACSVRDLKPALNMSTGCGKCTRSARAVLAEHRAAAQGVGAPSGCGEIRIVACAAPPTPA